MTNKNGLLCRSIFCIWQFLYILYFYPVFDQKYFLQKFFGQKFRCYYARSSISEIPCSYCSAYQQLTSSNHILTRTSQYLATVLDPKMSPFFWKMWDTLGIFTQKVIFLGYNNPKKEKKWDTLGCDTFGSWTVLYDHTGISSFIFLQAFDTNIRVLRIRPYFLSHLFQRSYFRTEVYFFIRKIYLNKRKK